MNPTLVAADLSVGLLRGAVAAARRMAPGRSDTTVAYLLGRLLLKGKKDLVTDRMNLVLGPSFCRASDWELLWKDHLRFIGRTLNEANDIERMDDNAVIEHIRLIDEEILREALERKRGVILLSNHFGNPASMLAGLGQRGYPLRVAIKPFRIPSLERRFSDQQESYRAGRIPVGKKLFFVVAETLREKGIFGFTIDYFAGYSRHVSWMQFGNTTMLTNIAPVLFALRTDTPVVYVTTRRHSNGTHTLTFHRDTTVRTGNLNTDAGSITNRGLQLLIDELKVSPAEWWIWDHARLGGEPRATA